MRARADLSIDGLSVAMPAVRTHTLPEPSVTYELNECMRKLEKRDSDFRRKERESNGHQAESLRWQKEHKIAVAELTSVRGRNEQLQQSLLGARTTIADLNSTLRDIEDSAQSDERLKKLESALLAANGKAKSLEMEVEALKKAPSLSFDSEQRRLEVLLRLSKQSEDKLNFEVTSLHLLNEKVKLECEQYEREIEDMRKRMTNLKSLVSLHDEELEKKIAIIADRNATLSRLQDEIEKLQSALLIRNETNLVLRGQLDEFNENAVALGAQEGAKLLGMEADRHRLQQRSVELANTVAGHASSLRSMDAGRVQLTAQLDEATANMAALTVEANQMTAVTAADKADLKSLRKEISRLRSDNQELKIQLDLKNVPLNREKEMLGLHHTAAVAMREKQHGLEAAATEKKLKRIAEESARSLHLRVCFLLEQLEQAAGLRTMWVEQKGILKAEIQALHKANKLFRKQLLTVADRDDRENGITHRDVRDNLDLRSAHSMRVGSAFITEYHDPESERDPFSEPDNRNLDLNSVNADRRSESLQNASESVIERAMFDMICAFSSASVASTVRRKRGVKPAGVYEIRQNEGGLYELIYTDSKGNNVDGDELLSALQIPMFFKMCQNRKDGKALSLLADKMAQILNFHRGTTHEVYQQLCSGRMEHAMLLSRVQNFKDQLSTAKLMYTRERVSKQTSIMKCVREQARLSDIRIIIDDVSRRAAEHLKNESENSKSRGRGKDGRSSRGESQDHVTALFQQIAAISTELSSVTVGSGSTTGQPGSMEISVQDCEIDDETLFGVMNVLKESSADTSSRNGFKDAPMPSVCASLASMTVTGGLYLDRILLLNLKGNHLTDLSSKTLCALVECSSELRMLDLRGNSLSMAGAKLLMAAASRNPSVLQTAQRKGRTEIGSATKERQGEVLMVMIEGLRELVSRQPMDPSNPSRVGDPKHPLRIDLRHNVPQREWKIAEDILESTVHKCKNDMNERGEVDASGEKGPARRVVRKFEGQLGPIATTGLKKPSRSVRPKSADAVSRRRAKPDIAVEHSRGDRDSDNDSVIRGDEGIGRRRSSDPNFNQLDGSIDNSSRGNRDSGGAKMGTDLLEWMGAGKALEGDQRSNQSVRDRSDRSIGARNEEWNADSNIDRAGERRTVQGESLLRRGIAELVKVKRRPASANASIRINRSSVANVIDGNKSANKNDNRSLNDGNGYSANSNSNHIGNAAIQEGNSRLSEKESRLLFPDILGTEWRSEQALQADREVNQIEWTPHTEKARRNLGASSENLLNTHHDNRLENAMGSGGKKKRPKSATRMLKKATPVSNRSRSASSLAVRRVNQSRGEAKENYSSDDNMGRTGYLQNNGDKVDMLMNRGSSARGKDSRSKSSAVPFPPDLSRINSTNDSMSEMDIILQEIHQQALNPALLF